MKINFKQLFIAIAIPLAVGGLSGLITKNSIALYSTLTLPYFAPPGWLFPIAWTILYILMGISSYLIYTSDSPNKKEALRLYGIQLFVNFLWAPVFFNMQNYLFALFLVMLLWFLIGEMMGLFQAINKKASLLLVPYFLWIGFAAYLNLGIFLLNR